MSEPPRITSVDDHVLQTRHLWAARPSQRYRGGSPTVEAEKATSTPAPSRPVSLASWRGGLSAWAQRLGVSNAPEPQHGYVNSTVDGQRV